ncbi:DUF4365 domain-containing protein [Streptomyces sp. NPDC093089]|uniref:DUF4365 domain-containing protein n=1 Tax=Streptomyces sp. NPDC093089 TaxID=3366024 RepID=UPI0038090E94
MGTRRTDWPMRPSRSRLACRCAALALTEQIKRGRDAQGSREPACRTHGRDEVRSLLERNGHIVQEIDGANDHGEDLHVTFVQDGRRTADSLAVQVKGGVSARTPRGYRVRVGDHGDNGRNAGLPVLCVVHDPERGGLPVPHTAPRSTVREKGTVAFTVPVNISPSL